MPRHPHTQRLRRPVLDKARKGNAEVPSDMELFFLELDALFAEDVGREERRRAHAQIADDMRRILAREEMETLRVSSRRDQEAQGAAAVVVELVSDSQNCASSTIMGAVSNHGVIHTELFEMVTSQPGLALEESHANGVPGNDLALGETTCITTFHGRPSSMLLFSDIATASLPQVGWPWVMGLPLQLRQMESAQQLQPWCIHP
ncbi:hypothetical protein BC830DRAFT_1113796 [Chytriomyces sp. MP71]|nr:hypothetical protein BC830DRAFT_1113796 [Chytriomyces sp. MP71]